MSLWDLFTSSSINLDKSTGLYHLLWNFTVSALGVYILLTFLIYIQSRSKVFLYYCLYNFLVIISIFGAYPGCPKCIYNNLSLLYGWDFMGLWPVFTQIIFSLFLFLFYKEFLDLEQHFPKFCKWLKIYVKSMLILAIVTFIIALVLNNELGYDLYFILYIFIFIPTISAFVLYGLYITTKLSGYLKYFAIIGVVAYNVFAYYGFYVRNSNVEAAYEPMVYFLIGIIIESVVFLAGLGYKVKLIFNEKINAQKRIIQQQYEKQQLEEKFNKELKEKLKTREIELTEAISKSEREKTKSLILTFEKELSVLRLESLRSQMNPHFIFNALNSIKAYIVQSDKENAVFYLNKFSKLIRKILENSHRESITLEEELETINLYLNIENIRFEEMISLSINNPSHIDLSKILVPGLILQPFIENSLWHGLIPKPGNRIIEINLAGQDDFINLSIKDNGVGRDISGKSKVENPLKKESLGIKLSTERIENFNHNHGTTYWFEIIDLYDAAHNSSGTQVDFYFNK